MKPPTAQRRTAAAAEGGTPSEEARTNIDVGSAAREAAWAERLAAALAINTTLEGSMAELQAQNARLRRRAYRPFPCNRPHAHLQESISRAFRLAAHE